jgi:hypothetical protein
VEERNWAAASGPKRERKGPEQAGAGLRNATTGQKQRKGREGKKISFSFV